MPNSLPLLASMPDFDPTFMAGLLVSGGAIFWLVNEVTKTIDRFRRRPATVIAFEENFTPLKRHEALEREVSTGFKDLRALINEVDEERVTSVAKNYTKTEALVDRTRTELREEIRESRKESRADMTGVTNLLANISSAVARLEGAREESRHHPEKK